MSKLAAWQPLKSEARMCGDRRLRQTAATWRRSQPPLLYKMEVLANLSSGTTQEDLAHTLDFNYPAVYLMPVDNLEPEEEPETEAPMTEEEKAEETAQPAGALLRSLEEAIEFYIKTKTTCDSPMPPEGLAEGNPGQAKQYNHLRATTYCTPYVLYV